jgi:hypothetical protein
MLHPQDIIAALLVVAEISAIIHCLVNTRTGREKLVWLLFIIFTNWIGALAYYIWWYGFRNKQIAVSLPRHEQAPRPPEQNYPPYEQGYRPIRPTAPPVTQWQPPTPYESEQEKNQSPVYEQPLVIYPEDPR